MTDPQLSSRLEAAVRTVDGVASVFSHSPQLVQTIKAIAPGADAAASRLVDVRETEAGLVILVSVGVHGTEQAPQTAAAVAAAVREAVGALPIADLRVRVSRVEG